MFVEDLVKGFYDIISKNKILILVNYDVDAICAVKILQCILRFDNIVYVLVPVKTITELKKAFEEQKVDVKYVVLINCGGTLDIIEILEPEEDITFFVVDSHRPTDICNIYSSSQVRILTPPDDEEKIPDFEDIFNENESSGEDVDSDELDEEEADIANIDSVEEQQNKRRKLDQSTLIKRRERRRWEENRKKLLFDYTQFSYYGRSAAMLMFDLAWKLHRESVDLLWWGIVGVTEQYILGKTERMRYLKEVELIAGHIGRICDSTVINDDEDSMSQSSMLKPSNTSTHLRIESEKDLLLALYRHWTIECSLRYSMFTAVSLKLWTIKGEKRLKQILAEMGLPLSESRQMYHSMDLGLRKQFYGMMEKISNTHNLLQMTYPSFMLHQGFKTRYQCADYVYSMVATLETNSRENSPTQCFYNTMDSLSRSKKDFLDQGIEKAKWILSNMFRHVQAALDMRQVILAGPFYYLIVQEGTLHSQHYSNPHCLIMLASFALRAQVASSRKIKATRLPLIASATLDSDQDTCLIVGIPPITESMPRSFFGKAFEQVSNKTNIEVSLDYFDSSIAKMQTKDRPKFFDALTALLS
ncbi:cell division control protein 45 homolog [Melanaphis sacchari]|uniref:cell division control protein 45 homolog n=1 Tax=Melanaphis sacchari TaxID=742174 RepID=UPI000DC13649|nr:cell division control protein 45 homolog [Melanaphis sacchari]XP_025193211.1 cell division control protein 45 homolog [Melanaphis sacchari]XP_025193295.1 cell division control protein 45 homolog [Melanaphis sacchari]